MFGRKKIEEKPYRSLAVAMSDYGGVKGFYRAVDNGLVKAGEDDYQRFYVPRVHACYLLAAVEEQLKAHDNIPRDIELSLARIEGLLAFTGWVPK